MKLATMGLLRPQPIPQPHRLVAPAPRQTQPLTPERAARVNQLLGGLLNVEEAANYLAKTPNFSSLLAGDLHQIKKMAKAINERLLAEFTATDAAAVDSLNHCAKLVERLCLLVLHCPPQIAENAANAADEVVAQWHSRTTSPTIL